MSASATVPDIVPRSLGKPYPSICLDPETNCLVLSCVKAMGQDIFCGLLTFIQTGDDGSRLTLQKNRQGFTLQVTGAVQVGHASDRIDPTDLHVLQKRLEGLCAGSNSS